MDNISGSGDWTVSDKVTTKVVAVTSVPNKCIPIDTVGLNSFISKLEDTYREAPNKNLYDGIINLKQAIKAIKNYG